MAIEFLNGIDLTGKLELKTLSTNTSSAIALVMSGNEVQKRTLGTAAFADTTDFTTGSFLPLAGGTMTGNLTLSDGVLLRLGDDTSIYSDGNDAYIQTLKGNLYFYHGADDKDIIFGGDDGSGGVTTYFRLDGSQTQTIFSESAQWQDGKRVKLGSAGNLQLQHTGTTGIVDNQTGDLIIKVSQDDGDIIFQSDNGSGGIDTYIRIDGGQGRTEFEKGTQHLDNVKGNFGSSSDMQIYHNGTNAFVTNATGDLNFINHTDNHDIKFQSDDGSGGSTTYFHLDGSVADGTNTGTRFPDQSIILLGSGSGWSDGAQIYHSGANTHINNYVGHLDIRNYADDGDILFQSDDGSGGITQYYRIDGGASLNVFSKDIFLPDNVKSLYGSSSDLKIFHNATDSFIVNETGNLKIVNGADDGDIIFQSDNGSGGVENYIQIDGSEGRTLFNKHIRLNDGIKAQFGGSADLNIFHDGSNTYFENKLGDLVFRQEADNKRISFKSDNGSGGDTEYFRVDGEYENVQFAKNINLWDNVQLNIGSGNDFQLYHNGSNSYLRNNTGTLEIRNQTTGASDLYLKTTTPNGLETFLYLDGSISSLMVNKDLLMFNDGNGGKLKFGASQDLQIFHSGSHSYIDENGAGNLYIRPSDNLYIQRADGNQSAQFSTGGGAHLFYNSNLKISTIDTGIKVTGDAWLNNGLVSTIDSTGSLYIDVNANNDYGGRNFRVLNNGTTYFNIDADGDVGVNTTSPSSKFEVLTTTTSKFVRFKADNNENRFDFYVGASGNASRMSMFQADGTTESIRLSSNGSSWFTGGNLGVGTVDPSHKLTVPSGTNGRVARFGNLEITTQAGTYTGSSIEVTGSNSFIKYNSTLGHKFFTRVTDGGNTLEALTIVPDTGRIGIGVSEPNTKLEVRGGSGTGEHAHATFTGTANRGLKISTTSVPYGQNDGTVLYDAQDAEAAGEHHWQIAGTTKMVLDKDGQLGVGTADPSYKLHNTGTSRLEGRVTLGGNVNNFIQGEGTGITFKTNSEYTFTKGTNTYLKILSDGKVGIGHDTLYQKFTVNGNIDIRGGNDSLLTFNNGDGGIGVHYNNTGTVGRDIAIKTYEAGVGNTEKMRITKKGDVGIGTPNPGSTLPTDSETASKVLQLTGVSGNTGDTAVLLRSSDNSSGLDLWHNASTGDSYIDNRFNAAQGDTIFRVKTAGTPLEALRIKGDANATFAGKVGVGMDPTDQLEVAGNIRANVSNTGGFMLTAASASGLVRNAATGVALRTNTTDRLIINNSGDASFTNNVTVAGDLIVNGTTTTLNTATVEVKDNILQLNTTQGTPNTMTASTSGISVFRGLDTNGNDTITQASLIFDEGDDTWDLTNNLKVGGAIDATGHIQAFSRLYLRESIQILNKAGSGWLNFAARNTSASEAVYDLSNVGTISTSGNATFGGDVTMTQSSGNNILFINSSGGGNPVIYMQDSTRKWGQFVSNGDLWFKDESSSITSLRLDGGNGNAIFAGDVSLESSKTLNFSGTSLKLFHDGSDGVIRNSTGHLYVDNLASDKDIYFRGKDGASTITALTLDMSEGGNATFVGDITISKSTPTLKFDNLAGGGLDPILTASGTNFTISTSSITPLSVALDTGNVTFSGNIVMAANATVDGVDISGLPTSFAPTDAEANVYSTAAELLTAIKTVDGSGSGLDADTLDTYSSSSFARKDEANPIFTSGLSKKNSRYASGITSEYPLGHYTPGDTVFEIDPTWNDTELKSFFNSNNVTWATEENAPGGYSIYINSNIGVGAPYGSGFPMIPIDQDATYYQECWIKNADTTTLGHYMGSTDHESDFSYPDSGAGNPGSYGYWTMSNQNPGNNWTKVSGYITGHHASNTGFFETDAAYFSPLALFNYSYTSGTRACWISGWKVIRVDSVGDRIFQDDVQVKGKLQVDDDATIDGTLLIDGVSNYTGLEVKGVGASRPSVNLSNATTGILGQVYATEGSALVFATTTSGTTALTLDSSQDAFFEGDVTFKKDVSIDGAQYVNQIQARTSAGLKLGNDSNSGYVFIKDSKEVCIGTTTPSYNSNYGTGDLNVENDLFASAQIFTHNDTAGNFSFLGLGKSSGTGASPTIVQENERIAVVGFYGYDGTAYERLASIDAYVDGTPGENDMPGKLVFKTTADGATSPSTRLTIDAAGNSTFAGHIIPTTDNTQDLGTTDSKDFRTLYVRNIDIYNQRFRMGSSGTTAVLEDHSTVGDGFKFLHLGAEILRLGNDTATSAVFAGNITVNSDSNAIGLRVNGRSSDDIAEINMYENDGTTLLGRIQTRTTEMNIGSITSIPLLLKTGGTTALTIGTSQNATFAGAVSTGGYLTLNSSDDIPRLIFNGSGDDFFFSNTANYFGLYNDTDSRWDIKVDGAGNTTFGGKIGIGTGTTAPTYDIDIHNNNGRIRMLGSTGYVALDLQNNGQSFYVAREGSTGGNFATGNTAYAGILAVQGNYNLEFATNGVVRQTINGAGNTTFAGALDIRGTGYNQLKIASNLTANTNKQSGIVTENYEGNNVSIIQTFQQNNSNAIYYGSADASFAGIQSHYFFVNADSDTAGSGHEKAFEIKSDKTSNFYGNVKVKGTNVTVENVTNPYIYLNDTDAGAALFQQEGNDTRIGSDSNTTVKIIQNNQDAVVIDTSKNATFSGNIVAEDSEVHVGDTSGDSWTRILHAQANGYGFNFQHSNATVLVNEQGSTNQALVLGDVDAGDQDGLFGIAHKTATTSWAKVLNLKGNGELYIGSDGTKQVYHEGHKPTWSEIESKPSTFTPSAHNHNDIYYTETEIDAKFTSTDGNGNEWKFKLGDEGNMTGNKWYKVAQVNQGHGGLQIKGFLSNHVETFGTQKFDIAIQGRETNTEIEITGSVDVLHNATGSGTDKVGIRVVKSDTTTSASWHYWDVYIRTSRYTQADIHLIKSGGGNSFYTTKPSVTSEPAPVSGGTVELDTSTLEEGNYVIDNSIPREIYHEGHKPTYTEIGAAASLHTHSNYLTSNANDTASGVYTFTGAANFALDSTFANSEVVIPATTDQNPRIMFYRPTGTGTFNYPWRLQAGGGGASTGFYIGTGSADQKSQETIVNKLGLSSSGTLTVKGDVVAYGSPSDKNYKENIKPIENALDKVMDLEGVSFDWKESDSLLDIKEDIGFIAQDVQKVVPELVRENEDGNLSLRYQGLIPVLLEAMKEQQKQIDELKSQMAVCNKRACNCKK